MLERKFKKFGFHRKKGDSDFFCGQMMETGKQEQDMHNLLVVDDEEVIREGMRRILEAEGYHVTTSASGRTAIEKIQEQDFDVVITERSP